MEAAKAASILALCAATLCAEAAPIIISTMPGPGDVTRNEQTYTHDSWQDLAVGFVVPFAGTITHITAYLDVTVDVLLPSAGAYWLHTRFRKDDVSATWTENGSIVTDLIARRTGRCVGASSSCNVSADRTFFPASAGPAPGFSITLDAPEPGSLALVAAALAGIAPTARRRT